MIETVAILYGLFWKPYELGVEGVIGVGLEDVFAHGILDKPSKLDDYNISNCSVIVGFKNISSITPEKLK